jgi:hypothetical protein
MKVKKKLVNFLIEFLLKRCTNITLREKKFSRRKCVRKRLVRRRRRINE